MKILSMFLLCVFLSTPVFAAASRHKARELLKNKDFLGAVASYKALDGEPSDVVLIAEYAYALALSGFAELSLAQLDRAFILDATNKEVLYFGSEILYSLGLKAAAQEISRPPPAWLKGKAVSIGNIKSERELGDFEYEFAVANLLMSQKRYVSAAVRFSRITRKYPDEASAWAGYVIALERISAYQTAARALDRNIELSEEDDENSERIKAAYAEELESRPRLESPSKKPNEYLKGRYLSFFGGSINRTQEDAIGNINIRLGKFFTNHFDAAINAGFVTGNENKDFNGGSFGISGRYHAPLPLVYPLNGTAGARLEYAPGPSDNTSFIFSPGLSYILGDGSLDLYLDIPLSGPLKDTKTLSLGYTIYFGGLKK